MDFLRLLFFCFYFIYGEIVERGDVICLRLWSSLEWRWVWNLVFFLFFLGINSLLEELWKDWDSLGDKGFEDVFEMVDFYCCCLFSLVVGNSMEVDVGLSWELG